MTGHYRMTRRQTDKHVRRKRFDRLKSCTKCFVDHERTDCPYRSAQCNKCGRKGHIKHVCQSSARLKSDPGKDASHNVVSSVLNGHSDSVFFAASTLYKRVGNQIWLNTTINGKKLNSMGYRSHIFDVWNQWVMSTWITAYFTSR